MIAFLGFQGLMLPCVITDMKKGLLSGRHMTAMLFLGLLFRLLQGKAAFLHGSLGVFAGLLILAASFLSRGALGKGDGLLCTALGSWCGPALMVTSLLAALCLLALYGGIQVLRKRKQLKDRLPLAPFLYISGTAVMLAKWWV